MTYRWYDLSKEEVLEILHSDREKGLSRKEAAVRLKEDGKNNVNPVQKAPVRSYLLQVVSDLTAILMVATALPAAIFRHDLSALIMLVLLIVNYGITICSYIRSQRILEIMGYGAQPTAKVLREGKVRVIAEESVVQGDILYLSAGDVVPCDARILEADGLKVLEGNLFGRERPSEKSDNFLRSGRLDPADALNMVYASTVILSGRCRAAAVSTGPDTLVCRMKKNKPIAACHKLDAIRNLKKISSLLGVLLLIPVFFLPFFTLFRGGELIEVFLASLAVAVAAIPEMYTAFAYVAISRGIRSALKEKKRQGAFIKNPSALPALGQLNCLLLPIESFSLERFSALCGIFDGDEICEISEKSPDERALRVLRYGLISTGIYGASRMISMNQRGENVYTKEQEALISACEKYGVYSKSLDERYPILEHRGKGENGSLFETTLVHYRNQDVVVLRGDPETVLKRCSGYCCKGMIHRMDSYAQGELLNLARSQIKNNRVTVAVATKNSAYNNLSRIVDCQSDLILEGFLFIEKPLLPGAAKQILKLRDEGIKVMVYSEEEGEEYRYLAYALGIAKEKSQSIRSRELATMDEEIFRINLKNYMFFEGFSEVQLQFVARTLESEYSMKIGMMGRKLQDVYPMHCVTVNFSEEEGRQLGSVPAAGEEFYAPLSAKKSSGETATGCQALNYVSDVILPPTDLSGQGGINAVSCAVRTARWIYRNINILLSYLAFSGGLRLISLFFGVGAQFMLSPVQTLFSGLIIDLSAALVIAFDRSDGDFASPYRQKSFFGVLKGLLPSGIVGGFFSGLTFLMGNLLTVSKILPEKGFQTFCFMEFFLLQSFFLVFSLRSNRPHGKNFIFLPSCVLFLMGALLFFAACYVVPPFGALFSVCALNWKAFLAMLVLPFLLFIVMLSLRFLKRNIQK